MPAPDPSQILDTPPPLTPVNLRNWPYTARTFPASDLAQSLMLGRPSGASSNAANDPQLPNRVE